MTVHQALAFSIIGVAIILFAWGRYRYDLISLGALLAGVVVGVVKPKDAFAGFSSDVVIIIASALVVSAAFQRSGIAEALIRPLFVRLKSARSQVPALAGATALLSMVTKNVGALAILMPMAIRIGERSRTSPSCLLMPMSFMALIGGLVTLVGTSTNIIASQVREDMTGHPFDMFDFTPVGLGLTIVGLIFVSFGYRLLPGNRQGSAGLQEVMTGALFSIDVRVPERWPAELERVADLELDQDEVRIGALIREDGTRVVALPDVRLLPGDVLVLEGDQQALDRIFARLPLVQAREEREVERDQPSEEIRTIEAVVQPGSPLVGTSASRMRLQREHNVKLLAVARRDERISERLRELVLRDGDVLVLRGGETVLPQVLKDLGLLPLAERSVRLGRVRRRYLPAIILAAAMVLVAVKIAPVAIAFFGAAVMVMATGGLSPREAYGALEPEVLILIGALTPLSEAVRQTGGTDLIAAGLAGLLHGAPAIVALGAVMVASMACSPFLHNAPTVLVLAPIGAAFAHRLGLNPDPFLMAVATGAGCDFLTPIGHQCNTLVMRPGGYRFGDYWRLGLPLSLLVIAFGIPLIAHFWPLAAPH
jgi:di/tricarboxylate transporter